MKYSCTECGYVFDESRGEPDDGIEPGTKLEDLGDFFRCPSCYTDASAFVGAKEEINYPLDTEALSHVEKDHQITYEIHENELHVKIGEGKHTHAM
jgi:rubredoxin